MHSTDDAPTLLCPECATLLDSAARCPACWGGSQTPLQILAYQIALQSEYGPMCPAALIERMRDMQGPHFERAAVALERAIREREEVRGRMAAA
jgi:hypothetical protein